MPCPRWRLAHGNFSSFGVIFRLVDAFSAWMQMPPWPFRIIIAEENTYRVADAATLSALPGENAGIASR